MLSNVHYRKENRFVPCKSLSSCVLSCFLTHFRAELDWILFVAKLKVGHVQKDTSDAVISCFEIFGTYEHVRPIHIWILRASPFAKGIPWLNLPKKAIYYLFRGRQWWIQDCPGCSSLLFGQIFLKYAREWRKLDRRVVFKIYLCRSVTKRMILMLSLKFLNELHNGIDFPWNKSKIKEIKAHF